MPANADRTLVFGDDHSPSADAAWLWINNQRWPGWRIEVITAQPGPGWTGPEPWQSPHPRALLGDDAGAAVVHELMREEPRAALGAIRDRDLMVVGPRGAGLGKQLGLGSVSESLLHNPPIPLVVVRHADPIRRVMVCADASPHCTAAIEALLAMPWLGETEVLVVSVPESHHDAAAACRAARAALQGAAGSVEDRVIEPDPMDAFYQPRELLLNAIRDWGADLAVLGTQGLSSVGSLRAGSIARSLAAHAPCSVLLAKRH